MYLHGDGLMLGFTLKRTVQVGLWSAKVLACLFPARAVEVGAGGVIHDISPHY
jgi:hypothetical protein